MKTTNLRKFILVLPSVAALALSPVYAGEQSAEKLLKPNWKQFTGKGYRMCDALLREMKSYEYRLRVFGEGYDPLCVKELIIPHSRLFKEPRWEKLDPQQYRTLLRKLFSGEFYIPENDKKKRTPDQVAKIDLEIDNFIANGGYLRKWEMPFPTWMVSEANVFKKTATPLTYVQTVRPMREEEIFFIKDKCRGINQPLQNISTGGIRLVNAQLDGPDPRLINYSPSSPKHHYEPHSIIVLRNTVGKKIYLYKNIPYFFRRIGVMAFSIEKKEWTFNGAYCSIYSQYQSLIK